MIQQIKKLYDWGCIPGAEGPAVLACPRLTLVVGFTIFMILVIGVLITTIVINRKNPSKNSEVVK